MEKVYPLNHSSKHNTDLKEAIYYLPPECDSDIICKALKAVYNAEGKNLAIKWFFDSKNTPPSNFNLYWDELELTTYQKHDFDKYLNDHIYSIAKKIGWIPKALRNGKQIKKPPAKLKLAEVEKEQKTDEQLDKKLRQIKEINLSDEQKSFIPPQVINKRGACYFHSYMKKDDIPEDEEEYLEKLDKIVDCEVKVLEAIEYMSDEGKRNEDKMVRYKLELNDYRGKRVETEVTHEELTTKIRFSSFLVSKGYVKFLGKNKDFDMFHEFLINKQEYPTIRNLNSWGEFEPGEFLFSNGIFSTKQGCFLPADNELRIESGDRLLICPTGSEQVTPPVFNIPKEDAKEFLAEKFMLWEGFNGSLNVRTTLGYAVACIFSREIMDKVGGFPILFKFGERGTGKSTSMDWLMALFGYQNGNRQSVSKLNTIKSLIRRMTLPRSFPFFLDDFRNHDSNKQAPDLTSAILNWYHRIGTAMAKKSTDQQTIETPMKACVVMTGNDKPVDSAALSRIVLLNYNKFLMRDELLKLNQVSNYTRRFSEFIGLLFEDYATIKKNYFSFLASNQEFLTDQGFQGRTVNNWAIILAGYQCIYYILPGLSHWFDDFEGFRMEISRYIQKEEALQNEYNPIHDFFQSFEFYATQKTEAVPYPINHTFQLDHRHFRIKESEVVYDHDNKIIYRGPVLAVHLRRIWSSLLDAKVETIKNTPLSLLESHLQNSSYYLGKSAQVLLTKAVGNNKEGNVRCYLLSVEELLKKGMLEELIEKAREYDRERKERII